MIIHDPYVDARHLRVTNDLNGLAVENLSEEGHTVVAKRTPIESRVPIPSGAKVVIGKTHLRIFSTTHEVPPVLTFNRIDRVVTALTSPVGVVLSTLAYLLFDYANRYQSRFIDIQWAEEADAMLTPLLRGLLWAALWALISRISRGEPRFFHHWIAVLMALSLGKVLDRVIEVIAFNVGNVTLNEALSFIATGCVLAFLLVFNLRFAFKQRTWVRHSFAYGGSAALLAYFVVSSISFEREFKEAPEFDSTLMPSVFLWRSTVSGEQFLENADVIFEFSEEELDAGLDQPAESL